MDKTKLNKLVAHVKSLAKEIGKTPTLMDLMNKRGISDWSVRQAGGMLKLIQLAGLEIHHNKNFSKPKILILDIEILPMVVYCWDMWPERIGQDQIIEDWSVGCWAAKWLGEKKIFYSDVSKNKDLRDDKAILKKMWELLDEADIVVTQNGVQFDNKKLAARFFKHKMKPYASYRNYDTKIIAKKFFRFSSNKLSYMTEEFNEIYKKLDHSKFPQFKLWKECMKRNKEAWKEMKEYNIYDILSLEELFMLMLPWDKSINWNVYHNEESAICSCGHTEFKVHKKSKHTNVGRYMRIICKKCGKEHFGRDNELSKRKKKSIIK